MYKTLIWSTLIQEIIPVIMSTEKTLNVIPHFGLAREV